MFTVEELFDKRLLDVPEAERYLIPDQWSNECISMIKSCAGVYILYSYYGEALYIGISSNLQKRVKDHLYSGKGNADIAKYYDVGNRVVIEVFYESNRAFQEVYESYLIHQLKPRFNVGKTGRHKYSE